MKNLSIPSHVKECLVRSNSNSTKPAPYYSGQSLFSDFRRRLRPRVSYAGIILFSASFAVPSAIHAQVIISASDIFNAEGAYYRAYANSYDPRDITGGTAYVVPSGLIGSAGGNQLWDFSNGPTNKVFRFDYVASTNGLVEAKDFPAAKIAERKTDEQDGSREWLFFENIPGQGRKVYGFYAPNPFFTPSNVFIPPIVDFPDRITFGQEWTTATTYTSTLSINTPDDPDEGELAAASISNFGQRITQTSKFKVDAYGTIILPDSMGGFGQGLRINEEVTIDVAIDFGEGQFEHVETDFTRNYYWVMPGYGIVAQLNSTQGTTPPPEEFSRAVAFVRMFETNKKQATGGNCNEPAPVKDLRIRISSGAILLTWSKADCATQYRVEYTATPNDSASWQPLGAPTANLVWQGESVQSKGTRFYRVVSLK